MHKYIGAIIVGVLTLLFSAGMSYIVYQPGAPKVYNSNLEKVDQRGYVVGSIPGLFDQEEEDTGPFILAAALNQFTADQGAKKAKKCIACHAFEQGGANKIGPALYNIMGAGKAQIAGFSYSDALKSMGGTWGYEEMYAFLMKPSEYAPGTKMAFAGFRKPEDAAKVIVYLRSLSDSPLPLPEAPEIPAEVEGGEPAATDAAEEMSEEQVSNIEEAPVIDQSAELTEILAQ